MTNPTLLISDTRQPVLFFYVLIIFACWILILCGVAEAATYGSTSGIGNINSANCSYWSTVLSNNDSRVSTTINVNSGSLNLSNATISMDSGYSMNVKSGATMNVTNGSRITRYSGNYYFNYESGSYGYLDNSTINYSYQLEIASNQNLKIYNTTILDNVNYGIYLTSTSGNVNITNSNITNSATGTYSIYIYSSGKNILRGNNINGTLRNLYVEGNYSNDIDTSNRVNGGNVYYRYNSNGVFIEGDNIGHITLYNSSNVSVKNNTLVTNGDGIRLISSSNNVTIDENTLNNSNYYGIDLTSSRANITNNTITTSDLTAISLSVSDNNNLTNNTVSGGGSGAYGIMLSSSHNNRLINNTVTGTGSGYDGIALSSSNYNILINNTLTYSSSTYGISLSSSSYNNISNNTVRNKNTDGIYLGASSNYNTISYNDITSNSWEGITIYSSHNTILNNIFSSNSGDGLTILSGSNNSVSNNNISLNAQNGIKVGSAGNRFSDNILTNNFENGIYIQTAGSNFSNNTITTGTSAGYGLYIDFGQYDNYIYQNNTVNGEKIYYYFNNSTIQTVTVESLTGAKVSNVGKISLIKCSNIEIKDNVLSGNTYIDGGVPSGIFLYNSTRNTISSNNITNNYRGIYLYNSSNNSINNLNSINTSQDRGVFFDISKYNNITNNILGSNTNTGIYLYFSNYTNISYNNIGLNTNAGIYFNFSSFNNLTGNNITGSPEGIFFSTSLNNTVFNNTISNYTYSAIRLIEYSRNNTMIGNLRSTRNNAQFDIYINDSNNTIITNNQTTAANYTYYLTGDTRLVTLDTVFNKVKAGYEDTSNLTLMWRIDVLSWDNKHIEPIWGNLTLRYGDYSDVGGILIWSGQVANANGRLSNNLLSYWGPPNSSSNWLDIIEYKQNATGKINYQSTPMNATVINMWDKLQNINRSYRNITQTIQEPGVTIIVDAGYTPNGKCYYCHMEKLSYTTMVHWTDYSEGLVDMSNPYTPGRCIDCHDQNDSANTPHGTSTGNDMLVKQSPQLCYNGNGNQTCHNSTAVRVTLDQKSQFNQTTHHQLGEGKMTCFSCHDNHGTDNDYDLHRQFSSSINNLCYVCHLQEKLKAGMIATGYLGNFKNQTNFRDQYFDTSNTGFNGSSKNLHDGSHYSSGSYCRTCHTPHGSSKMAMTRTGLGWTYVTNLTPPGALYPFGDWANQTGLNQTDWSNFTLNQAAGFGTGTASTCWYHGSPILPSRFAYRQFIDYESAGGPGCVECHNSSTPNAIRKILNVSALKLAMHKNLSWNFRNGGELQGTGKNWTQWGEERGYNASNISTDNAICWSCHSTNGTPPYPGFHPDRTLSPYMCPKCHGYIGGQPPHTAGLVVAIDNHGPTTKGAGSVYIQTNVGTNGSCENCHSPSKLPNSSIGTLTIWKDGSNISYTGRTTAGDVSHYGLTKSQGIARGIANPLFNTSNCISCHTNSTKGAIWGSATNISGNMYGANTSNVSQCYTYCHVLPDYVGIVNQNTISNFHNISLYAGGGPDCVTCHDMDSTYHVQSLVNITSIALGIHGNMGNNTIELIPDIDPRSKPCWGCHQSDGYEPEGMGDRNGIKDPNKRPWTCEDCHTRSSEWVAATGDGESWLVASYPPNKLPPRVYAHYPNSSTVKTNVSGAGRCVDCHNNSIDPYSNDTTGMVLGNTVVSNVSHYGVNRSRGLSLGLSNPLFNTTACGICHNSTANASKWGNATQNDHGNFFNNSAEDGCYPCHTTDNQIPSDFHTETLSIGQGGFDCLKCHNNSGLSRNRRINGSIFSEAVHRDLNNASTMEYGLNRSCWTCHFENGLNASNHSMRKVQAYLCFDCHNKLGAPFSNVSNAPNIYNHFKNGTNISAYLIRTTDSDSCMGCHNNSEMFNSYLLDENETNPYSTNYSITSHYGSNRTDLVDRYDAGNSTEYCSYCHVNLSTIFIEYGNDKNIRHSGEVDCSSAVCHGPGRLHNESLVRPHTSGNCTDCHALYGANRTKTVYWINATAMNKGVHASLNSNMTSIAASSPINDANNAKCWGCHVQGGAYPENGHEDILNNNAYLCYDCHNGTAKAYNNVSNAPEVYNHRKNGVSISARTTADTISESCGYGCHNLTSMKVAGFDAEGNASYRVNLSQASHYARNRTDIIISNDLSDCTWCHRNSTNEFLDIFERKGAPNFTENIAHATSVESCILTECHKRGRIHDLNLIIPTWQWDDQLELPGSWQSDYTCKDCHYNLNGSNVSQYYVNETMFNEAVHWNMNCTLCHVRVANRPASLHPVAEYYWKWCECCHSYQNDSLNSSQRHNITSDPFNYMLNVNGNMTSVLNITDCTFCHNAADYNRSVAEYSTNKCRYCHEYPDMGNKTGQSWY